MVIIISQYVMAVIAMTAVTVTGCFGSSIAPYGDGRVVMKVAITADVFVIVLHSRW